MDYDQLLKISAELGFGLLRSGAEIYRVEESVERVLMAYGVTDPQVFAIPSLLIVTIGGVEGRPITQIKRLRAAAPNMDRVELLNDLCRRICRDTPSAGEALAELDAIMGRPLYPLALHVAACSLTAFCFALVFGGNLADACCAAVIGVVIRLAVAFMEGLGTNPFFRNIIASGIVAIMAMVSVHYGLGQRAAKIIIGTLMNLVPGVMITNCMRDIIAGDLIAGLFRLVEALMVGTAIALGAGIAISAARMIWGV